MPLDLHLQWPPAWWLRRQEEKRRRSQASEEATLWRRFRAGELEEVPPQTLTSPVYAHSGKPLLEADQHRYLRAFQAGRRQGMTAAEAVDAALFAIGTRKDVFGRDVPVAGFPPLLDHSGWEYAAQEEVLRRLGEAEDDSNAQTVKRPALPRPVSIPITEQPTMQVPVSLASWLNTSEQDEEFTWGQVPQVRAG